MEKLVRRMHRGEKGLTLIELLIVIAILGIIAAVIIPNISGFLVSGNIAAANTEVENVKTGALGYFAKYNTWPETSANLTSNSTGAPFVSGTLKAAYTFDTTYGWVLTGSTNSSAGGWSGITFTDSVSGPSGKSGRWVAS